MDSMNLISVYGLEKAWASFSSKPDYQRCVTTFFKAPSFYVGCTGLYAGTSKASGRRAVYCDQQCCERLSAQLRTLIKKLGEQAPQIDLATECVADVKALNLQSEKDVKALFKDFKREARYQKYCRKLAAARGLLLNARRWTAPFQALPAPAASDCPATAAATRKAAILETPAGTAATGAQAVQDMPLSSSITAATSQSAEALTPSTDLTASASVSQAKAMGTAPTPCCLIANGASAEIGAACRGNSSCSTNSAQQRRLPCSGSNCGVQAAGPNLYPPSRESSLGSLHSEDGRIPRRCDLSGGDSGGRCNGASARGGGDGGSRPSIHRVVAVAVPADAAAAAAVVARTPGPTAKPQPQELTFTAEGVTAAAAEGSTAVAVPVRAERPALLRSETTAAAAACPADLGFGGCGGGNPTPQYAADFGAASPLTSCSSSVVPSSAVTPIWPPATPRCCSLTAPASASAITTAAGGPSAASSAGGYDSNIPFCPASPFHEWHCPSGNGAAPAEAAQREEILGASHTGTCLPGGAEGVLVVCCSIDLEWWERDNSQVTEVGWTLWNNLTRELESKHHIVAENKSLVNRIYVPDHKHDFLFGRSRLGSLTEGAAALQADLDHYGERLWARSPPSGCLRISECYPRSWESGYLPQQLQWTPRT